jgi:hypothetical protein
MANRLLLPLALAFATLPALSQTASAPIQTAQADQKPAPVEQSVVLPDSGFGLVDKVLIGVGVVVGLALLSVSTVECNDGSGGCGENPSTVGTGPTGTR